MSYRAANQREDGIDFIWNESQCRGAPLHRAVLHNSLHKVKDLVDDERASKDIVRSQFAFTDHETGQEGRAEAIHIAASRGHLEIMKYLLEKNADPAAKVIVNGQPKYDVLHAAVHGEGRGGRLDMVDFLHSVAPATKDSEGRSLIHIAFMTGSKEIIEYLQDRNTELKHMNSFRATPRDTVTDEHGVHAPLSFGILGGQMSEDLLSEMAQPTAGSLKIFIQECPQCIPAFLERIASNENITATEIARHLTCHDIAKVLRESPEAALALLQGCTTEPECGNSGWHALPTRVSFADRDWMQSIRTMFNPVRHMLTFYKDEVTWKFDSNRFEHPEWHKYITNRDFGRPVLDAEIQVCHVQDILCAEVFGAMCTEENVESEVMADDNLIRAMVRHVFWNGCCRVDLTTVLLNFWGLGLLIAEEILMYDEDAAEGMFPMPRMGKGRRLFRSHANVGATPSTRGGGGSGNFFSGFLGGVMNEGEDPSVDAWIAISWIGAKGVIDAWQEWLQFRGFCKIGRASDYFALDNLLDMVCSCFPMLLFLNPDNTLVLVCAVFLYWCRLLDCFTSAEFIGLEILPIRKMALGLLPALAVTLVAFCAFTHAFYLVNGGPKVESMMDVVFETFATLITAALPPDISTDSAGNQVKLVLCIMAVSFFTVFILNIFIGVMGELYVKEKQRSEHTFRMYRASSCYQYLLRSRVLPGNWMSERQGFMLMVGAGVVSLSIQFYGFIYHSRPLPGTSIVFFVCQALILLGAYQSPDSPWVRGGTKGFYLWFCKEKTPDNIDPLVQDVTLTLEHMKDMLSDKKEKKKS